MVLLGTTALFQQERRPPVSIHLESRHLAAGTIKITSCSLSAPFPRRDFLWDPQPPKSRRYANRTIHVLIGPDN